MTQTANSYTARNSRSKLPLQVELTGNVGELVAEEFRKIIKEMERMKQQMDQKFEQQNAFLKQVMANTKYPLKPYTVNDFEAMFGLGVRAQQKYRKEGKLGFLKLGEAVLYTHQHILDFIQLHDSANRKTKN